MHIIYFPVENGGNFYVPNKMNQVTNRGIQDVITGRTKN